MSVQRSSVNTEDSGQRIENIRTIEDMSSTSSEVARVESVSFLSANLDQSKHNSFELNQGTSQSMLMKKESKVEPLEFQDRHLDYPTIGDGDYTNRNGNENLDLMPKHEFVSSPLNSLNIDTKISYVSRNMVSKLKIKSEAKLKPDLLTDLETTVYIEENTSVAADDPLTEVKEPISIDVPLDSERSENVYRTRSKAFASHELKSKYLNPVVVLKRLLLPVIGSTQTEEESTKFTEGDDQHLQTGSRVVQRVQKQDETHEFIKTLNYDEIVSSIEIVQQLQKAITDSNQRESDESTKIEREIKQEKEAEGVLIHSSVSLDNLKSEQQQCRSSGPVDESNLNKLIQELSSDELDQSIQILKQLQKVLVNADGSESAGEFSDVKQEESYIVLNKHGNPLSKDCTTGSRTDSEIIYQDALRDYCKETFSVRDAKIFCESISLVSSNSKGTTQSPSFSYKEVEYISRIKEESIKLNLNQSEFPEVSTSADKYSVHAEVNSEFMANPEYFPCVLGRNIVSNKNIGLTTIREYPSENEINFGQCPRRRDMEKQLNRAEREPNTSKMELSREKQIMQTNSRRRKNTNVFCGSKLQTRTCSKPKAKVCDFCQKQFQRLFDLKKHVKMHTGQRPYTCERCEYKCIQSSQLTIHMRKHTGDKPYTCEMCEYRCTSRCFLNAHIKIHKTDKPYACEICEYKCTQTSHLKRHMRTHSGERPYKCEICNHKFTLKGNLKIHMRTHSGERPYKCEICKYKFTEKGSLKLHMRTHLGERSYKCEICSYKCTVKWNLKIHMRIHSGDRPYQCEKCKYKCTQKGNLKRHIKTPIRVLK